MEITFDVRIAVGTESPCVDTLSFSFDYDLEEEDLNEYAKELGYENGFYLVKSEMLETFDEEDEEISLLKEMFDKKQFFAIECEMQKSTLEDFKRFMKNKYQKDVDYFILGNLTSRSEKTLNEMKRYDF